MAIQVRYLSEDEIERDAELLLTEYEATAGEPIKLPIPVDEITTYHLALRLGFADLHETLGVPMLRQQPDILGAIWIDKETVLIDQSLNPGRNPSMRGRYRFSVGHEIGHWRLHRSYVAKDTNQASLFDVPSEPTIICRTSQAKERVERQADLYASCLLMPRQLVDQIWCWRFGNTNPHIYEITRKTMRVYPSGGTRLKHISEVIGDPGYDDFANAWAEYFAPMFSVSRMAMRIRLEKLGFLLREVQQQRRLAEQA